MTKVEDLIALIWAQNECYTCVVSIDEVSEKQVPGGEMGEEPYFWKWPKLELDLKNGTWKHGRKQGEIGNAGWEWDACHIVKYGLIGIYDRTKIDHLNSMVHNSNEAVR